MPTQTRSQAKAPADGIYRSTGPAPKQKKFPPRRSVKTYGRRRPAKDPNQETLTQMNFTSSAMREFAGSARDEGEEEEEEEAQDDEVEEIEPPKPTRKAKSATKPRGNRRKTADDELFVELQQPPRSKRRKTLGDLPNASVPSSFHTQTLTQMLSVPKNEEDVWRIKDSEDEEDIGLSTGTSENKPDEQPEGPLWRIRDSEGSDDMRTLIESFEHKPEDVQSEGPLWRIRDSEDSEDMRPLIESFEKPDEQAEGPFWRIRDSEDSEDMRPLIESFENKPDEQPRDTLWRVKDSEDEEDFELFVNTPRKEPDKRPEDELVGGTESGLPSLIKSATPSGRQIKTEIPSSQSPATPMLLRYNPIPHSPLMTKSTNVAAPSPNLKQSLKRTRSTVIPDSYSTTHDSPTPTPKSTVKATPSKRLRFELPEDKENITPGRTKPKSPKPKSQTTGRRPLREVPDSDEELDEDLDETEYETETEDGVADPGTPTPRRLTNVIPPSIRLGLENGSAEAVRSAPQNRSGSIISAETQELGQEHGRDYHSKTPFVEEPEAKGSPGPPCGASVENSPSPRLEEQLSPRGELNVEKNGHDGREASRPAEAKQAVIDSAPASIIERTPTPEPSVADEAETHGSIGGTSVSTQDYMYTQGLESQRVSLDAIHAMGPQTPHSDIMVSLYPEHVAKIISRRKDHEFRVWKIPPQVSRIWIYITSPESQLKYMCIFSDPKAPGEIKDEKGIGNAEFNRGKTASKFAYEIQEIYELNNPVSLEEMKAKGWVNGAPQKFIYIPPAVVGELTANLRCALFGGHTQAEGSANANVSESQELKAQLQSDADYSTQHYSDALEEVVPASQSPHEHHTRLKGASDKRDFVRPALPKALSVASSNRDQGSPKLPSQRRGGALVRASQATTVSQVSSSPAISPQKSTVLAGPQEILISSQSSPTTVRRNSSLRSSQFPTMSQLLPDSLLDDNIHEPPPIIYDSADEGSS